MAALDQQRRRRDRWSFESGERDAERRDRRRDVARRAGRARPGRATGPSASRHGLARMLTSPDFDRPCGASAGARFVHVITGTIALNGTPATAAFQTAPPPSEMPSAPICVSETSLAPANQSKSSCVSCTSRGPSRPNEPAGRAVPRASHASVGVAGRAKTRRDRLHVRVRCAEAVEEHDSGPAAGRRRAVGMT